MPAKLRESLVNAILGIVGTLLVLFGTGAWASKESTAAHAADMAIIRDSIHEVNANLERILDALCDPQPRKPRTCGAK